MQYISTRGGIQPIGFNDAVMMGLASDGGLLLPATLPKLEQSSVNGWQYLPYQYLAVEILGLFIDDISRIELEDLVERSYASFLHPQITPVAKYGDIYILELFHGPTLAFKDVALQLLGNIFEYELTLRNSCMNILGATSGDTGSAAIYGVRGKNNIHIFIMHPEGRVSPIQALQMTTVMDSNVFNLAVRGTFDDAQRVVKTVFNDLEFKEVWHLGAINSINWARVLAQVVYYVYAWFKLKRAGFESIDFSVPTGNFGDIFAGYIAKQLLPEGAINKLILATNANDILARFVTYGDYSQSKVVATYSPSMDIQIASNFERYLYYLRDKDPARVSADMKTFENTGRLDLSELKDDIHRDFVAGSVTEEETIEIISTFYRKYNYLVDPHTAVGIKAAHKLRSPDRPVVCLATAHPAKFGKAVKQAIAKDPVLPSALKDLGDRESRCQVLDADPEQIKRYIMEHGISCNG